MKTLLKISLVLISLLILGVSTILYSSYGTSLFASLIEKYGGEVIAVEEVSGTLASDLQISNILITTSDLDIHISSMNLDWTLSTILLGQFRIANIQVEDLALIFKDSGHNVEEGEMNEEPFALKLPETLLPLIGINIDDLVVKDISFRLENGKEVENIESFHFKGAVGGEKFSFDTLAVEDEDYNLSLSGRGRAGKIWQADIMGDWRFSNWSGGELLGTLAAKGPVPDMDIRVALITPAQLDIRGKMKNLPSNPYFEVTGHGENGSLVAVHPSCPEIVLDAHAEASGYINDYKGWLTTTGDWGVYEGLTGETRLEGNFDNIHFSSLLFKHQETSVEVKGGYLDWVGAFSVGGKLYVKNYNPGIFNDVFSASLNGEIDGLLTVDDTVLGEYSLKYMTGQWQGYPVSGDAKIHFTDEEFVVDEVLVKSGKSTLLYNATFSENMEMAFSVDSPAFQELLPNGYGQIKANVQVQGNYQNPVIKGDISATDFGYYGLRIASLAASMVEDEKRDGHFSVNATGTGLDINGQTFGNATAEISGKLENHSGKLLLQDTKRTINASLSGSFKDNVWSSEVGRLSLQDAFLGKWQLSAPAELQVSGDGVELDKGCFKELQSTVCLSLLYESEKENDPYQLSASFDKFFIERLSVYDFLPDSLTGVLSGNLNLNGETGRLLGMQGDLDLIDGTMTVNISGKDEIVHFRDFLASMSFDGERARLEFGTKIKKSTWQLLADTKWDGTFNTDPHNLPLTGNLNINSFDISLLGDLFGYEIQPSGSLTAEVKLLGTFAEPQGDGTIFLENGSVNLPTFGIQLTEIEANFAGNDGVLDVQGRFNSGGGFTEVLGTIRRTGSWDFSGQLSVAGSHFLLLNLPEYEVYVNPDLDFEFDPQSASLRGAVFIPKAYIAPEEMTDSVKESSDVIFVDGIDKDAESNYRLSTRIRLDLGDDVTFQGYGLKGRLNGGLDLIDEPSKHLEGTGSLSLVDATFSAYGRSLDIARGKILFTGGSVLRPGVDVRAQRTVSDQVGSRGGYTVGIDISGLIPDLNYSLFSNPYMDDGDILAYLVLGHSLLDADDEDSNVLAGAASALGWEEQASVMRKLASVLPLDDFHIEGKMNEDDMSLVVGKRITKDLYFGYDYNLRDQIGEVRLRYDLKYGFFVESRNSSESTGADLLYVIER